MKAYNITNTAYNLLSEQTLDAPEKTVQPRNEGPFGRL